MAGYNRRARGRGSSSRSRHPLRKTRRTGHSRSRRRSTRPRSQLSAHAAPIVKRPPVKRRRRREEEEPEEELEDLGEVTEPADNFGF